MNTLHRKRILGFTIIELMIVLVIIAIIMAIAYPSYVDYTRRAKRGEAQQLLMNWAVNQEIWRSNNPQYDDGTNLPPPNADSYNLTVSETSATAYLLTATPIGDQKKDKARGGALCDPLTLDQNGVKSPPACWE